MDIQTTHSETAISAVTYSRQRTLRVLHVVNGEYYAGAERVQDLLALNLPAFGCEVGFACVKPDQFPIKRQCQDVPLVRANLHHPWSRQSIREIADIVDREGYDLLHSHTPRSSWAAMSVGQMVRRPVVHTMHDVFLSQNNQLQRRIFNKYSIGRLQSASFVTTVSPESQRLADQLDLGKRRCMILNGVPGARPDFVRVPPSGQWTIGTVGLIRPCKGIEVLIRAIANLRDRGCPAQAVVVGTFYQDDYQTEVMRLVDQLDVGELIDFVGFSSDVPGFLEKFDLFAMPSVGPEGLPMVLLEAMAHGLPTIGSDVAGVGDVIRPEVDGLLFPPGDDVELADAVEQFINGNADWSKMSDAARSRHEAEFSARRMASEFAEVYRQVVAH